MFVTEIDTPEPKVVTLEQIKDGVIIKVNGFEIAKLDNNDDRILLIGGITKKDTGLDDSYGGRAKTVWLSDAETSRNW